MTLKCVERGGYSKLLNQIIDLIKRMTEILKNTTEAKVFSGF